MKLHEYLGLMPEGEELTVFDKDYDMETYFYSSKPDNKWDKAMSDLSKLLTVEEIRNNGVIVNLSEIVGNKIEELRKSDLFIRCDVDFIMYDMDNILAGNVSETWMVRFVEALG